MDKFTIIAGTVLELAGLIVMMRLWLRRRMRLGPRIFFSIVLLIPFFGLLIYGFLMSDLSKNPDRLNTQSDSDAFHDSGGGH